MYFVKVIYLPNMEDDFMILLMTITVLIFMIIMVKTIRIMTVVFIMIMTIMMITVMIKIVLMIIIMTVIIIKVVVFMIMVITYNDNYKNNTNTIKIYYNNNINNRCYDGLSGNICFDLVHT